MDILEAIKLRKSIRGYKPEPVPKAILREIIEIALRAPSSLNTQPWQITVIAGKVLDNIKKGNVEKFVSGAPSIQETPFQYPVGIYKQRQVDLAIHLFQSMGITREDKEKRVEWQQRGIRFFDAPVAVILSVARELGDSQTQYDCGALTQTICLVALNYGLGTCIEGQGVMFPEVIRKFTDIPESQRIVISIAVGYPDWDFPANKPVSPRVSVDDVVTWQGFD